MRRNLRQLSRTAQAPRWVADHSGAMVRPETISTAVSIVHRSISVLYDTGDTIRYALAQSPDGEVFWREDTFGPDADGVAGKVWLSHGGRLSVADVCARVPQCSRDVMRWTQLEIEAGPDLPDGDVFTRMIRADALARLRDELDAAGSA